ncbi:hypothetical protein J7J18_03620 [bacterium]|nr:hypothetical protein [bacterium]
MSKRVVKKLPDRLKLGKVEEPADLKHINKSLKKAKAIVVFTFEDDACHSTVHGYLNASEMVNAFCYFMEDVFKVKVRAIMFEPVLSGGSYVA